MTLHKQNAEMRRQESVEFRYLCAKINRAGKLHVQDSSVSRFWRKKHFIYASRPDTTQCLPIANALRARLATGLSYANGLFWELPVRHRL